MKKKHGLTRPEAMAAYLKKHKSVTPLIASAVLGDWRISETIRKLRTTHSNLLPADKEIVTVERQDDNGVGYGEYVLRDKKVA
jgi:hypothetical protein